MNNVIKYIRNCPSCGEEHEYKNKYTLKDSVINNRVCLKCKNKNPDKIQSQRTKMLGESSHNRGTSKYSTVALCNCIEQYHKHCPTCNGVIKYTRKFDLYNSLEKHSVCRHCVNIGNTRLDMRGKRNIMHIERIKRVVGESLHGKKRPDIVGDNNPSRRPEVREKLRKLRLNMITPCFNSNACKIIEDYGKIHGYNFQHALNGGEVHIIGYSLDGYDKEKNVIIEYYEKHHNRTAHKIRDEKRKKELVEHLKCKFIELKEEDYPQTNDR